VRVTEAGRAGHVSPETLRGATFTVTNFGTEGGRFATPIVRPPQVAILGFGAVRPRPVVDGDTVIAAPTLPVSLSPITASSTVAMPPDSSSTCSLGCAHPPNSTRADPPENALTGQ